jgi:hypothetical protein
LLEADRVDPGRGYADAALANVRWALKSQRDNGWFERCCLADASNPLTHTIGYALRGLIEAYRFSREGVFLEAARRTADGLSALRDDGHLPMPAKDPSAGAAGLSDRNCADCLLLAAVIRADSRYALQGAAFKANEFVRRSVRVEGPPEMRGAVKGSLPVSGAYGRYQYLSWAGKFLADSLMEWMFAGHVE